MSSFQTLKKDFPIFTHHPDLVYLDSSATALKPQSVIDAEISYLTEYSTNIARGLYPLAERVTEACEITRRKVSHFIGAKSEREIIFTAGTTDALNLASKLLAKKIHEGENIVTTMMEHHSNFLPWKELARKNKAEFRVVSLTKEGAIDTHVLKKYIDKHTKIFAFSALSNVLGIINPVEEIILLIRSINPQVIIIVDTAQAVCHLPIDVIKWDADFIAFSGHKMFGPTGIGVLYGKLTLLETLSPVNFGGGMVLDACADEIIYKESPYRFEAGTPNIGGIIALGSAIEYIENIGLKNIARYERSLTFYTREQLKKNFGKKISLLGPTKENEQGNIVSFSFKNIHPHDIAGILGEHNICVRAGEHCTAPLHRSLSLGATTRISLSVYNDENDIDKLISVLKEIQTMFR